MTDEVKPKEIALEETPLQASERRRTERRAERQKLHDAQRVIDLDAVSQLEDEYGLEAIKLVDVPFLPGSVTLAAVRRPSKPEFKRYQDTLKNNPKDTSTPCELVGKVSCVYPPKDAHEALFDRLPALPVEMGMAALTLVSGRIADEGKG